MNPKGIPDNFIEVSPGNWAHPSRVNPHMQTPDFSKGILVQPKDPWLKHVKLPDDPKPPRRIRQSTKPLMNKLESEFHGILQQRCGYVIHAQAIRFMLGNGIWYKPDFIVLGESGIMAYEVKGKFAHRGGFENLKVAAHEYCHRIYWFLVWKENGGWCEQRVLP